jgi:hypothetical protein
MGDVELAFLLFRLEPPFSFWGEPAETGVVLRLFAPFGVFS